MARTQGGSVIAHELYDDHDPAVRQYEPRLKVLAKSLWRRWQEQSE